MNGLRGAVALLTRVPVSPRNGEQAPNPALWFPIVGAFVGALVAGAYAASSLVFPASIAAAFAVLAGVLVTGAIHEDGLGDLADALWGGWSKQQRLEILQDPRVGAFGVLALVFSVLLRVFALATLPTGPALWVLVGAHSVSRTAVVLALWWFRPASGGLASYYSRSLTAARAVTGLGLGVLITAASLRWWSIAALAIASLSCAAIGAVCSRRLGGITGDALGTVEQGTEILVLLLFAAQ